LRALLVEVGIDPERASKGASSEANRTRLKAVNEEARSRGVFGAPTFFAEDGEMFWGNDRLEQAIAWAAGRRASSAPPAGLSAHTVAQAQ
jgi:2-hydroxychromene-2-carboxylate isomerase